MRLATAGTLDLFSEKISNIIQSYTNLRDALQSLGEEHAVIAPAVGSVVGKLNESIAVQQSLYDKLSKAAETIRNKPEEALTSEEELDALLEQSAQSLSKVQSEYEEQVKRNLDGLYASLGDTRSSISGLLKQLDESADGIYTLSGSASSDLSQIKETLDTSGSLLEKAASRLTETVWKLNQAQSSGRFPDAGRDRRRGQRKHQRLPCISGGTGDN